MNEIEDVAKALASAYDLPDAELQRVLGGQATVNYSGSAGGRQVFVKVYPPGTDLAMEEAAIELSEFAAAGGIPTAPLVRSLDGEFIHRADQASVSVWGFVTGETADELGLAERQMVTVGAVLGRLHRVLATHPAASPRVAAQSSALCDVDRATRKIRAVLERLSGKSGLDDFEAWAAGVLRWRLDLMPRISELMAGLPPLTSQIVHGDFAAPNVLFTGDRVAAVIDFRPPSARPVAWEISRLGCAPRTVLRSDEWLRGLCGLAAAYREEHPNARVEDLVACVRAWTCYSAASIYPFDDLLTGSPLLPDPMKEYARDRQDALVAVMGEFNEAEASLRGTFG